VILKQLEQEAQRLAADLCRRFVPRLLLSEFERLGLVDGVFGETVGVHVERQAQQTKDVEVQRAIQRTDKLEPTKYI